MIHTIVVDDEFIARASKASYAMDAAYIPAACEIIGWFLRRFA